MLSVYHVIVTGLSPDKTESSHRSHDCDQQTPLQSINHSRNQHGGSSHAGKPVGAMTTHELQRLVKELQADLSFNVSQNRELQKQLEAAYSSRLAVQTQEDGGSSAEVSLRTL